MATKSCPDLFCLQASGQVGKQFIYWQSKGYSYKRAYVIPYDPRTPRTLTKRAFFRQGTLYWNSLSQAEKDSYNSYALTYNKKLTGYDCFFKKWLRGEIVQETIRSVQSGYIDAVTGINDVAISAVSVNKCLIIVNSYASSAVVDSIPVAVSVLGGVLTSSTNLRIETQLLNISTARVYWQVIEYY